MAATWRTLDRHRLLSGVLDDAVVRATDTAVLRARVRRLADWRAQGFERYSDDPS